MSDSFVKREQKPRDHGEKRTLMETYSKNTGFQLNLNTTYYKDGTHDMSCAIEMCPGVQETNSFGGVKTKCDWANEKIMMSLSPDELAMFSKYTDSYYLRRLGTKVPMYDKTTGRPIEKDGRPVFETESNGSPKVYSEKLFHKFKDKTSTLQFYKNSYDPMGCGITINKDDKKLTMFMNENTTRMFCKCCEIALEQLVLDDVQSFKYSSGGNDYSTPSTDYANRGFRETKFTPPERRPQPTSYRSYRDEPPTPPPPTDDDYPMPDAPFNETDIDEIDKMFN